MQEAQHASSARHRRESPQVDPARLKERMAAHIEVAASGCWLWTAHVMPNGYGTFHAGERSRGGWLKPSLAHRVSYELHVGPIPPGLGIDHLCRNRRCVNPEHLEPVTTRENNQRGKRLITHCRLGHPYAPENTYVTPHGHRQCRICKGIAEENRKARRRAAA